MNVSGNAPRRLRFLELLTLVLLLATVGESAFQFKSSVLDLDLGWHLKTGDWILAHAAVPHTGLFNWTAADHPWAAYSWGYEVLLSLVHAHFGIVGIGVFGVLLTLAVAYAIYWMSRRLAGNFWMACLIAVFACAAFLLALNPRPVFFSMILFCVTLALLMEGRRNGREKLFYWLPLVFLLWANLHIQFVYGLFAVGLLLGVSILESLLKLLKWQPEWLQFSNVRLLPLLVVFAACLVATCIGPYSYHLYGIIARYAQSHVAYRIIMELQPMNFRVGSHYVELLLLACAFFAVGRQKKVDAFKFLLLCVTAVIAFRTMRDAWFLCISAAACIADAVADGVKHEPGETWLENVTAAVALVVVLTVFARRADFTSTGLDAAIAQAFPVNAVNYVREHPVPGHLYNALDWGGFLIWYLPEQPVAIDGRTDLYGDQLEELFYRTAAGAPSYLNDPYLNESSVVILPRRNRLENLLEKDPRFQIAYQDELSAVFVRR